MNAKIKSNITEVLTEIENWCIETSSQLRNQTSLKNSMESKTRKRKFKEVTKSNLISVRCPYCSGIFGMETKFLESTSEVNLHYGCPYCGEMGGLEKD